MPGRLTPTAPSRARRPTPAPPPPPRARPGSRGKLAITSSASGRSPRPTTPAPRKRPRRDRADLTRSSSLRFGRCGGRVCRTFRSVESAIAPGSASPPLDVARRLTRRGRRSPEGVRTQAPRWPHSDQGPDRRASAAPIRRSTHGYHPGHAPGAQRTGARTAARQASTGSRAGGSRAPVPLRAPHCAGYEHRRRREKEPTSTKARAAGDAPACNFVPLAGPSKEGPSPGDPITACGHLRVPAGARPAGMPYDQRLPMLSAGHRPYTAVQGPPNGR